MSSSATPQSDRDSLDLDGWIKHLEAMVRENLEAMRFTPEAIAKWFGQVQQAFKEPAAAHWVADRRELVKYFGDLPAEDTLPERLARLLPVIWADYRVWYYVHLVETQPSRKLKPLNAFLLRWYGLHIPFTNSVWIELRSHAGKWAYLTGLMIASPRPFFDFEKAADGDYPTPTDQELISDCRKLGHLLYRYLRYPGADWRVYLHSEFEWILDFLVVACKKIAADASWSLEEPNRFEASRAPALPHRVRSLEDAQKLEQMVGLLRDNPVTTDYDLAKRALGNFSGAGRRLAKEARRLALYRDRLPVKFHRSSGDKRPPR